MTTTLSNELKALDDAKAAMVFESLAVGPDLPGPTWGSNRLSAPSGGLQDADEDITAKEEQIKEAFAAVRAAMTALAKAEAARKEAERLQSEAEEVAATAERKAMYMEDRYESFLSENAHRLLGKGDPRVSPPIKATPPHMSHSQTPLAPPPAAPPNSPWPHGTLTHDDDEELIAMLPKEIGDMPMLAVHDGVKLDDKTRALLQKALRDQMRGHLTTLAAKASRDARAASPQKEVHAINASREALETLEKLKPLKENPEPAIAFERTFLAQYVEQSMQRKKKRERKEQQRHELAQQAQVSVEGTPAVAAATNGAADGLPAQGLYTDRFLTEKSRRTLRARFGVRRMVKSPPSFSTLRRCRAWRRALAPARCSDPAVRIRRPGRAYRRQPPREHAANAAPAKVITSRDGCEP